MTLRTSTATSLSTGAGIASGRPDKRDLNAYSRRVVGWSIDPSPNTAHRQERTEHGHLLLSQAQKDFVVESAPFFWECE
jgi:hypothetical protein